METERQNNRSQLWLGILVSLVCLIFIFIFIKPADLVEEFRNANFFLLALSGLTVIIFLSMRAVRWRFLLRNEVPYSQVFHIQNIGYMLNVFLPARLGDLTRAVLIGSIPPVTIAIGLSTTVVDRLLDMIFVVAILPFALAAVETLPDWMRDGAKVTGIAAIIGIIILIIAANQRPLAKRIATAVFSRLSFFNTETWVRRVDDLLKGLDALSRPKDGLILIILTILVWIPIITAYVIALTAVGLEVSLPMAIFVFCAAAFSVALPSSPGQIGVFHSAVIAAIVLMGLPEAKAGSFAFAYHGLNMIIMPTLLGLIGLAATGATLQNVWQTTQTYLRRQKTAES